MSEEEKQAVLAKTRIFVREAMAGNDAAHDYAHIQRVMHTAQIIADTLQSVIAFIWKCWCCFTMSAIKSLPVPSVTAPVIFWQR